MYATTPTIQLKPNRLIAFPVLAAMFLFNSAAPVFSQDAIQSWTNTAGKTIEAEFIRIEETTLIIRKGGTQFKVPLSQLSAESQLQARELAKSSQTRTTALSPEKLAALWERLLLDHPIATHARLESMRALLVLAQNPKSATEFLAENVKPVQLTRVELIALLSSLGSDQDSEWQSAYERLQICDPRLFMDLEDIFHLPKLREYPARNRFADLLFGLPIEQVGHFASLTDRETQRITLVPHEDQFRLTFERPIGNASGKTIEAYRGVSADEGFISSRSIRAAKSLLLLASFDTPSAGNVILSVASGHPKAMLTKMARSLIEERKAPSTQKSLPDLYGDLQNGDHFELLELPSDATTQLAPAYAALRLIDDPVTTTQFIGENLQPAEMTSEEYETLLDQLAGDDKTRSREGYTELLKFNRNWELDEIDALLERESFQEYPARHRLVDLITCTPWDSYLAAWRARYKFVTVSKNEGDTFHRGKKINNRFVVKCGPSDRFRGASDEYWADETERAAISLLLLKSFQTERADELIKSMASGHPKATLTRFAQSLLDN